MSLAGVGKTRLLAELEAKTFDEIQYSGRRVGSLISGFCKGEGRVFRHPLEIFDLSPTPDLLATRYQDLSNVQKAAVEVCALFWGPETAYNDYFYNMLAVDNFGVHYSDEAAERFARRLRIALQHMAMKVELLRVVFVVNNPRLARAFRPRWLLDLAPSTRSIAVFDPQYWSDAMEDIDMEENVLCADSCLSPMRIVGYKAPRRLTVLVKARDPPEAGSYWDRLMKELHYMEAFRNTKACCAAKWFGLYLVRQADAEGASWLGEITAADMQMEFDGKEYVVRQVGIFAYVKNFQGSSSIETVWDHRWLIHPDFQGLGLYSAAHDAFARHMFRQGLLYRSTFANRKLDLHMCGSHLWANPRGQHTKLRVDALSRGPGQPRPEVDIKVLARPLHRALHRAQPLTQK